MALSGWNALRDRILNLVAAYHRDYPLRRGIPREELKSRLKLPTRQFNAALGKLVQEQQITDQMSVVARPGHEIRFSGQEQAKVQGLMRKFAENPFSPPGVKECQAEVGGEVFNALVELGDFMTVSSEVVFRRQEYDLMLVETRRMIGKNGSITLAEARDLFKTSRKYVQAFLEHLDVTGITVRDGDLRKLRE
jgi:selenocysteine-specific elongation factor